MLLNLSKAKLSYSLLLTFILFGAVQSSSIAQVTPTRVETGAASADSNYILGAGDQVSITVFGYEEYTGTQVILPDGTIKLALLEPVKATGKTTEELAQELKNRLQSLLVDPVVTVSLTTLRPVIVNVAGEVQRPGPVQLRSLTNVAGANTTGASANSQGENTLTVADALVAAGGITQNADIRRVVIKRNSPDGNSSETTINLWNAIVSNNPVPNIVLQDGDSLYIPRLVAGNTVDRRLIARTRYAPNTVRVRVVGEVKNPGEVQVSPDSSISSAVAIAGGPTIDAKLSQVAYIRLDQAGNVERQTVDLRNLTDNYQVQEGDVVIVPKKGSSSFLDSANRFLSPIGILLRVFGL